MKPDLPQTPLISAEELAQLGPIRMLYVPAGDENPPGMTRVPIENWISRAKQSRSGFDDLGFWQDEIRKLGIGPDALSVVVDDGRMTEAARVWFILQYFGLPATVLNGGIGAISAPPRQVPPANEPASLEPGAGPVGLMDRTKLKTSLDAVQVFDARTAEEFRGEDRKGGARGGHLPGASHLSHVDLLEGTRLKDPQDLSALISGAGLDGSRAIVSHCHGGGRAALAALAAVIAGASDVHVYYLSFADWAADESCPLVDSDQKA